MPTTYPRGRDMEVSNEFSVCTTSNACVSVNHGRKKGEVIVSFKSGAIQVYNVHDLRMVHSWQLSTSEKLLCGAIAHPQCGVYWAVSSKQGLVQWSEEVTVINSSSISISTNPVLLMVSHGNPLPLIVYSNGDVGYVGGKSVALVTCKSEGWQMVMVDVSCDGIVCVVGKNYKKITIGIAESASGQVTHPFTSSMAGRGPVITSCVCGDKLLLLCDKGDLLVLRLERPLHPILYHHTLSPPLMPTSMLSLSCDYFILASDNDLQLWENIYGTCQHKIKVQIRSSKVWCVDGSVYVWSSDKGLRGWRVNVSVSKLSGALGKLPCREVRSSVLPFWPTNQKDMLLWEERSAESASIEEYLGALVDSSITSSLEVFTSVFDSQPITANISYHDVIKRLLSEEVFWGCGPLSRLLVAGVVPSNINMLSQVVAREDWKLVETYLTHGPNPSEKCIVNALQKVFSLSSDLECTDGNKVKRKDIVYKLLCQPFNDVDMEALLAGMPFPIIKDILSFLSDYVNVECLLTSSTPFSYDVILEWVGLILDVHFTHLIFDRQCQQMLISLQSKILTQVMCLTRLSGLNSIVQVQEMNCNYDNQWLYKVEKLNLKI